MTYKGRRGRAKFPSTSCTPRIWAISNIASFVRVMRKIIISQETWSTGSVTSLNQKQPFECKKYRCIANRWMIVINTSYRVRRLGCDLQINDSKCQHRSWCTLTTSQPLITRIDTSRSCCPVWTCHTFQPTRRNWGFSTHHTRKKAIFVLSWTICFDCKKTWRSISSMNFPSRTLPKSREIISLCLCVHPAARNWRKTRWNISHMWQVSIRMPLRPVSSRLDSISAPVIPNEISNSRSTRRTIDCQCISTMDRTTTSHSSWNLLRRCPKTSKSFQPPRTRRYRSNIMVFNSRTRWNSLAFLSNLSWLRCSVVTSICTCTPRFNSGILWGTGQAMEWRVHRFVDMEKTHVLQSHQIVRVIEQYNHSFSRAMHRRHVRRDDSSRRIWSHGEAVEYIRYQDMGWILRIVQCTRCDSRVNTTNCTMYSMWLSWPMRSNIFTIPHWRHLVLIPCITSQHHRWHIRSSWRSHLKAIMAWRHWRHCLRSGLYTSHEPIPTRGWVNSIWRRSSWITWVNFIRTRAFDWWRQARSMTSCDCWRTCVEASHKLWNSMPRSTLTTSSNQLLSVKAFIISMPTICIVEPCIEWCLTN